jgi:hypothetical protein
VLSGETHASYFLLEQGSSIKAQLMITYEWSDWRAAIVWWIQSVYVKPQHRQQVGSWQCTSVRYSNRWRQVSGFLQQSLQVMPGTSCYLKQRHAMVAFLVVC